MEDHGLTKFYAKFVYSFRSVRNMFIRTTYNPPSFPSVTHKYWVLKHSKAQGNHDQICKCCYFSIHNFDHFTSNNYKILTKYCKVKDKEFISHEWSFTFFFRGAFSCKENYATKHNIVMCCETHTHPVRDLRHDFYLKL